jgi:hypothetical protein
MAAADEKMYRDKQAHKEQRAARPAARAMVH